MKNSFAPNKMDIQIKEFSLGFEIQGQNYFAFFGKKSATLEQLTTAYPNFKFRQLKQTHSDICIESQPGSENIEADAHWTIDKNIALVIRTADCIPALLYDHEKKLVLAVHAGWRGVENQIILKALRSLKISQPMDLLIGPHIRQNSFEIDNLEIKNQILASGWIKETDCSFSKNNKFYIDLERIFLSQIEQTAQLEQAHLLSLGYDTKTDSNFHSYRRDQSNAGRNLSFIVKI